MVQNLNVAKGVTLPERKGMNNDEIQKEKSIELYIVTGSGIVIDHAVQSAMWGRVGDGVRQLRGKPELDAE